ncbi:hypothetical protein B0A69_19905 [Chryseobacterium shigense]|uniref:Lipoprotein n=1 Tax=Chryseobacterium shigense TaxID=297244 RepID=A0A1N7I1U9_9FLAO|nr:hypothetical protein [Chryseobacterium shigense]PQA90594.1 hypothetical protein B0A69_19905 [Chryseobacterium shigense]SIS31008.1 hypothetical protein SAMN05421639_1011089 [Chryseobacterium shigense]
MFHKAIIFSLGMLTLAGCDAQKKTKTPEPTSGTTSPMNETKNAAQQGGIIYLNQGDNKFLKEYEMNVTFKGISEDSRCPEGANCIWAGVAVAQIEVMGTYSRPMILSLATTENAGRNFHQSQEFNGYTISLEEVSPFPKADGGAKALEGKYKVGITIKKTEGSGDPTRK